MNLILSQAKPSPISACAGARTWPGASQGRADLDVAHVNAAITALCVSSKRNEATKTRSAMVGEKTDVQCDGRKSNTVLEGKG